MGLFVKNVGKTDKIVRFIVGLFLFAMGIAYFGTALAYVAYFLGLILVLTSILGTAPFYTLLGFNTLEPEEGCKCKEGEACVCEPECGVCSPGAKKPAKKASSKAKKRRKK